MANPSLGFTLDESTVLAEYETDPASVFEVEVLCRKVLAIQSWVSPDDWQQCASDAAFPLDCPMVFAIDASVDLQHVSIVAGALKDDWHYLELIASYTGQPALASAERRLESLLSRWSPVGCVTVAKSPCEASVAKLAGSAGISHIVVRPADWARACRAFYAAARQKTIRHPGGPGIAEALGATRRGSDGLVSSVHKINPQAEIDAALAAVLAMWAPTQIPEPVKVPNWTVY